MMEWLKNSKCLVTGGAGFIGSTLCESLVRVGAEVTVLDDFSTGREEYLKGVNLKVMRGSVTDFKFVDSCMPRQNFVFHLAAISSVQKSLNLPNETALVNIIGTQNVLEAARRAGVNRVVYSSSASVYGGAQTETSTSEATLPQPLSPYAAQKLSGEFLCQCYSTMKLQTVSLRYFNVFGARQSLDSDYASAIPKFMSLARAKQPLTVFGDGKQSRDFVHVNDIALANCLATRPEIKMRGDVLNIGNGVSLSILDLIAIIGKLFGRKQEVVFKPARSGEVYFSQANITAARRLLKYDPQVKLEDGLSELMSSKY